MYGPPSPNRRRRSGLWFAGFTIASLLMLLASSTEPALALQRATTRALDPVRGTLTGIGEGVAGLVGAVGEIDRLRSENDRLRRELSGAEQRIAELTEASRENNELRQLLGISQALEMELLPVRVISRDPSNLAWEVGIDAGSRDGLRVGMPVVGNADGAGALAGTVVAVTDDTARVQLVVDTRSVVIALEQSTRALGEVRGQPGGQLIMVNVPITEALPVGGTHGQRRAHLRRRVEPISGWPPHRTDPGGRAGPERPDPDRLRASGIRHVDDRSTPRGARLQPGLTPQ